MISVCVLLYALFKLPLPLTICKFKIGTESVNTTRQKKKENLDYKSSVKVSQINGRRFGFSIVNITCTHRIKAKFYDLTNDFAASPHFSVQVQGWVCRKRENDVWKVTWLRNVIQNWAQKSKRSENKSGKSYLKTRLLESTNDRWHG